MQQITSYVYDNEIRVVYSEDASIYQRNRLVYAREINLFKGVSNTLKVRVLNDHQKPLNLTDKQLVFTVVDDYVNNGSAAVLTAVVVIEDEAKGIGTVTISSNDLQSLTRTSYKWAIKIRTLATNAPYYPTFVDDNFGTYGQLKINDDAYAVGEPVTFDLGDISDGVDSAIYDLGEIQ